jgi:hypothetical protein
MKRLQRKQNPKKVNLLTVSMELFQQLQESENTALFLSP